MRLFPSLSGFGVLVEPLTLLLPFGPEILTLQKLLLISLDESQHQKYLKDLEI
ncbi:hypothetical protein AMD24_00729 [Candidatus Xiphinematobacter sp. Idaho Grape]|nr:hypothetical protein AMD24_00729 [Candidatus Xiphinematobacter sp. Idaho Grape]